MNINDNESTAWYQHPGGILTAAFSGDFDGGTLAIEVENGADAVTPTDGQGNRAEYTEEDVLTIELAAGCRVRGTMSGATDPDVTINFIS